MSRTLSRVDGEIFALNRDEFARRSKMEFFSISDSRAEPTSERVIIFTRGGVKILKK